jgi:peptidyl-prolyl cis-trans isomerase SurA
VRTLRCFVYLFVLLHHPVGARAEIVDRIRAIVNDRVVTQSDLNRFSQSFKNKGLVDEALLFFYDAQKVKASPSDMLNYLIDETLIDSEVARQGINVTIEKVEAEIKGLLASSGMTKEAMRDMLKKKGVGYAEYQNLIQVSRQRKNLLQKEIQAKIKISDDDIAAVYLQGKKDYKALIFEYELSHILFLPKNGGAAGATGRAEEVKSRLDKGQSFESLASQYSEDPDFTQGGVFGVVKAGEIVPQLEKALAGLQVGETTGLVAMGDGVHIFKVLKKTLVPSEEFLRLKPQIADRLYAEAFKKQYLIWIESLRRSAYLKINT